MAIMAPSLAGCEDQLCLIPWQREAGSSRVFGVVNPGQGLIFTNSDRPSMLLGEGNDARKGFQAVLRLRSDHGEVVAQ